MTAPYEIIAVEHRGGHQLRLTFADGFVDDIDLAGRFQMPMGPMLEPLSEEASSPKWPSIPSSAPWRGPTVPTSLRTFSTSRHSASPDRSSPRRRCGEKAMAPESWR